MANQYEMLKQENKIRSRCLSPTSQEAYGEAVRYFKQSNRHPYDTELMYKELIGIGLAADARGESLGVALGEAPQEFYMGLVENARPNTLWDLFSLRWLPFFFAFYAAFELLIWFAFPVLDPIPVNLWSLVSLAMGGLYILLLFLWERKRNIRNSRYTQLVYIIAFVSSIYLQMQVVKHLPSVTFFAVPAWLGAMVCVALWYGSSRYRDYRYEQLAKEKPWQG